MFFLRFLRCSRDPLRGSAWSRCKNSWFFAISNMLARPSAGIGVVEVQELEVFCDVQKPMDFVRFLRCSRNPLRESAWWRCKSSRFLRLLLFELVFGSCLVVRAPAPGTGGSRVRFLPGPRAGVARCNLHFKATCAEQLAQSNLRRASCTEQLAQTNLHRPVCGERLAGSAICTEQLAGSHLQGPTCRSNLRGATCAEQLAQCNLRRATCADQLAPTSLRRAPCLVLSRACFTNASRREKERILQRWADLACDVLLSGQPWSSWLILPGRTKSVNMRKKVTLCQKPYFFGRVNQSHEHVWLDVV